MKVNLSGNMYSSLTEYPKLYKKSFWGTHKLAPCEEKAGSEFRRVCANRNKFVEENKITKSWKYSSKVLRKLLKKRLRGCCYIRHQEYYMDEHENLIHVFSKPEKDNETEHQAFLNTGYVQVPPLYSKTERSYMRKYELDAHKYM